MGLIEGCLAIVFSLFVTILLVKPSYTHPCDCWTCKMLRAVRCFMFKN